MFNLLEFIVCLLAFYGLIMLVLAVAGRMRISGPLKHPGVRVVLLVKNAEEQIEYIVRNAVKKELVSLALSDDSLLIVDMNSSDNTYRILEKLQKDFSSIEILEYNEKERIFEDFSIFSPPAK